MNIEQERLRIYNGSSDNGLLLFLTNRHGNTCCFEQGFPRLDVSWNFSAGIRVIASASHALGGVGIHALVRVSSVAVAGGCSELL